MIGEGACTSCGSRVSLPFESTATCSLGVSGNIE